MLRFKACIFGKGAQVLTVCMRRGGMWVKEVAEQSTYEQSLSRGRKKSLVFENTHALTDPFSVHHTQQVPSGLMNACP